MVENRKGGSMSKIIIHCDNVDDVTALSYVLAVIDNGKISNNNTQYSYITSYVSGHVVYADKTKSGTFKFRVHNSNPT